MPGPHVEGKRSFTGKLRAAHVRPLRLSKNSLAPSGRGLRPQAVGERASRRHEGFGQRRGSLPPALRATSLPEGGFLTRRRAAHVRPLHGGYSVGVSLSVVDSLGVTGSGAGAARKTSLQREHTTLPSGCSTSLCPSAADSSVFVSPQLHW